MSTQVTRRRFIEITPLMGLTALAACSPKEEAPKVQPAPAPSAPPSPAPTPAAAPPAPAAPASLTVLDEKDPQATALGYVEDASRADTAKFKNHVVGNLCSNCGNYLGSAADSAAGCKIFPGKSVVGKGWCTAWIKMA
jgi:hypothetical protein